MDVRTQQIIVQQHMNDRLAEARMARLAREARQARTSEAGHVALSRVTQPIGVRSQGRGIVGAVLDLAAALGRGIHPAPPLHVRVARH